MGKWRRWVEEEQEGEGVMGKEGGDGNREQEGAPCCGRAVWSGPKSLGHLTGLGMEGGAPGPAHQVAITVAEVVQDAEGGTI